MNTFTFFEQTILDNINFEGYNVKHTNDKFNRINEAYKIFLSEKKHEIERESETKAFESWLRGLCSVISVPFYYEDIINSALSYDVEISNEVNFTEGYWTNLTNAFFTLKENL